MSGLLFQRLQPLSFFWAALSQAQVRENNRLYHSGVVVWLMICQRLLVRGTLESGVRVGVGLGAKFLAVPV